MFDRVLGRENQERLRQRIRMHVDSDLGIVHGFKQRGLRFGRGAVDFVRQQDIREDRSMLEFELLLDGGIDGDPQHVRGQHVAGELDPLKAAVECPGERLAQGRFTHPWNAFNQQVATGEDRYQRQADHLILAANDFAQGVFELNGPMGSGGSGLWRHRKAILLCAGGQERLPT